MSAEQQDQRPKSSASSKKSVTRKSEDNQQRGHQLSDDGPVPATTTTPATQDAYQQLSDDQPEGAASDAEKTDGSKPKKENPLKKLLASLKSLNCTGKPANFDKSSKSKDGRAKLDDEDDEENNTPNARPVSQSSLESKKVVTEKSAPQIEVRPSSSSSAVEGGKKEGEDKEKKDGEEGQKKGEEGLDEKANHAPLTTTVISATPPTL